MGSIPTAEEMADQIQRSTQGAAERETLLSLYSGDTEDDAGDDTGGDAGQGSSHPVLDEFRLLGIIGCNSFGEEFTDFASFTARTASHSHGRTEAGPNDPLAPCEGDQQVGHLGLFPSFSMLNHSCLPNAVNFVVAGRMMGFAARNIPKGSEVVINYLGRGSLRPVDERQAHLAEGYHFSCGCPRCQAELLASCIGAGGAGGTGSGFTEVVQGILSRCEERSQLLDSLAAQPLGPEDQPAEGSTSGGNGPAGTSPASSTTCDSAQARTGAEAARASLERCLREVRADVALVEEAVGTTTAAAGEAGPQRQWLRASAFDLYEQQAALAEALGEWEEADGAARRQVAVCEDVAPCSDLHMYLAVKGLSRCQARWGPASQRAQEELARCAAVVRGRYGSQLSDETVELLLRGAAHGLSQVRV